ncbi:MAG: type I phosphomannose isomerase catalytic subunit [Candidatus Acidiferrum sp.]
MGASSLRPEPFRIEPIFSPRIWGVRSLAPLFPEKSNLAEPIGEAWLTGVDCKVATGPFAGKTLGAAWREMPAEWRGTKLASMPDFPLLVKFIFPADKLSIQVHPDDAYASVHEKAAGGRGKTEMWHAVSAEPSARVLVGLIPKTDEEIFLKAIETQTLEDIFVHWRVQPGDTFFVPAGTPHTIGPNMVICEVQEYSDLTYRVYDYGRVDAHHTPRELHIEKALQVIEFGRATRGKTSRICLPGHGSQKYLLAACPYFATERWKDSARMESHSDSEHFDLFVILSGSGDFAWDASSAEYQTGECWLLPASLGKFALNPKEITKVLRTYIPDLPNLRAGLEQRGLSWQEIENTVFD